MSRFTPGSAGAAPWGCLRAAAGIPLGAVIAYRDAVGSVTPTGAPQRRLPPWAVAEGPFGVRLYDAGIVVLVIAALEVNITVGNGPGSVPLNLSAYLLGALLAVPILFRHRWPFQVMIATAVAIFFYVRLPRPAAGPARLTSGSSGIRPPRERQGFRRVLRRAPGAAGPGVTNRP
jgi:hypothetical protein